MGTNDDTIALLEQAIRNLQGQAPDEYAGSDDAPSPADAEEDFTPAEPDKPDTEATGAAIGGGEPPVTFSTSPVPESEGGQTFTANDAAETTETVKTEPVVYDANDPDNPGNKGESS